MALLRTLTGPSWPGHVRSRREVLEFGRLLDGERDGFILLLVDEELHLLDAWKLPRPPSAAQEFLLNQAAELAVRSKADGMIVVQFRGNDDPQVRSSDLELTRSLRRSLEETGTELVDHLLVSGDVIASVTGPSRR